MTGRPPPVTTDSVDMLTPAPSRTPDDDRPVRRRAAWSSRVAMIALIGVFGVLIWRVSSPGDQITRADVDAAVRSAVERAQAESRQAPSDAAVAYSAIAPSMVTVRTTTTTTPPAGATPGPTATPSNGLGSGVVIGQDGSILTALHVVADTDTIEVVFADGTRGAASIRSRDAANDIAVLTPSQPPGLIVPAVLGGGVGVGDPVFAVGNPFGLTSSLTVGAVSALGRSITPKGGTPLKNLIQFDAAVNPGSSGGPLLDRSGQVVGIVTGLANPADQAFFVGIGFAVPIATAAAAAGGGQK